MTRSAFPLFCRTALLALGLISLSWPALAEKADKQAQMVITSEGRTSVDMQRNVMVLRKNVVITKGSLRLTANLVETRDKGERQVFVQAMSEGGERVRFRQRSDLPNVFIEGEADRIDYDEASQVAHLIGKAEIRRFRDGKLDMSMSSDLMIWDGANERYDLGGTEAGQGARQRIVVAPRATPAASAASSAAQAPDSKPSTRPAP